MILADNTTSRNRQTELGQFLTPSPVAEFMASLFHPFPRKIRLVDAGAGAGALTSAVVNRICRNRDAVESIDVVAYEFDPLIQPRLFDTLRQCAMHCARVGVEFRFNIHAHDFIHEICPLLNGALFGESVPAFDVAIVNPPYRKISSTSVERRLLRSVGIETSNLYTAFVALLCRMLVSGGQMVAITPRSFCNGPYFQAFREDLFRHLELRRLHVFESRDAVFHEDEVLQENIIFHGIKNPNQSKMVTISSSSGKFGAQVSSAEYPFHEIVRPDDAEKFIHIPSNQALITAKNTLHALDSDLASLGLSVSTGRVVDFRSRIFLRQLAGAGTAPLIYPCHFNGGNIHWPKSPSRKPNAIIDNEKTRSLLVPHGTYVLTKRFTSKEERRRLVACLLDAKMITAERIGFENHVNYFHEKGHGLERYLALGLFAFLNSTVLDHYFRRFSGHTQVNATDLRSLVYPNKKALQSLGHTIQTTSLSQVEIDNAVRECICAN